MRGLALLLLILVLAPGTWLRDQAVPPTYRLALRFVAVDVPEKDEQAPHLGPFRLERAWRMESPHTNFGGYSSLVALDGSELLSASDLGYLLHFAPPGTSHAPSLTSLFSDAVHAKANRDVEALTRDPSSGTLWMALEGHNSIARTTIGEQGLGAVVSPPAMRDWASNSGPEAMERLDDGRFVVLAEEFVDGSDARRHRGLLFATDPLENGEPIPFTFLGPKGFSPTDMAQLPDGRVLILMRKLVWPFPARFAGRLVLADPATIDEGAVWQGRVVARLTSPLPVDNFEGIAIAQSGSESKDDRLTVWLISDDNGSAFQTTLLWKLSVDPADLSDDTSKKARGNSARPSSGRD